MFIRTVNDKRDEKFFHCFRFNTYNDGEGFLRSGHLYTLEKSISRISTWGKFTGILNIIFGGLGAFFGLFAYIVGAIPGVVQVVLGVFLYQIGKQAGYLK